MVLIDYYWEFVRVGKGFKFLAGFDKVSLFAFHIILDIHFAFFTIHTIFQPKSDKYPKQYLLYFEHQTVLDADMKLL